mgnify:CR=1 FL=1
MLCDVCKGNIKPRLNESGAVVWDKGHNADPLSFIPNARCCDVCNEYVLQARLQIMFAISDPKTMQSGKKRSCKRQLNIIHHCIDQALQGY